MNALFSRIKGAQTPLGASPLNRAPVFASVDRPEAENQMGLPVLDPYSGHVW